MSVREIEAGAAYVRLYLKGNEVARGLAAQEQKLRAFGQRMTAMGRELMQFGAVAMAPLALSARIFAGFDDQMRSVQAVTGATADEYQRLYDLAKKLGRTTSFTAGQVGGGQLELGRAGFKPAEIEASTESVLNLARATGTELPEAAGIAAGTLRAFGLEADQMGRVADVMTATANSSAQTLTDLGESMAYAAPHAMEYGLSLEETSKAMGVMANMQIKGSSAGTGLRTMLMQLSDPAIRARLQGLGVDLSDFGETMIGVGRAMATMSRPERIAFAKDIFGKRAAGGALKLAQTDFPAMSEAIDTADANDTAAKTAEQMDAGLGGVFRKIASAAEGVAIAIGEALSGSLEQLGQDIIDVAGKVTAWIEQNQVWIRVAASVAATLLTVGAGVLTIGASAKIYTMALAQAAVATKAFAAASAFLLANPLVLTFAATAAAVVALGMALSDAADEVGNLNAAQEALAAGDKQRSAALGQMEALQQLAEKERLSNEEKARAKSLIEQLTSQYGDLGLSIDETTGKIQGLDRAQGQLNERMREAAEAELRAALAESQMRSDEKIRQMQTPTGWERFTFRAGQSDRIAQLEREINVELKKQEAILQRIKALRGGDSGALTGTDGGKSAAELDGAKADAQQARLNASLSHSAKAFAQEQAVRNEAIADAHRRELANIKLKYDTEVNLAKLAGKQITEIEEIESKRRQEIAMLEARRKRAASAAEEQLRYDTRRAEIENSFEGVDRELELLDLDEQRELKRAAELGIDQDLVRQKYTAMRGSVDVAAPYSRVPTATSGTFSAFAAQRMGGQTEAARTAKATEETAKNTKKIVRQTRRPGIPVTD